MILEGYFLKYERLTKSAQKRRSHINMLSGR
jgi:hypothetical protein